MATDFEQIKRLPPETKVIELRRLIENLRKHIDEHQRDIRTAENLLALAEDEQKVIEREAEKTEARTTIKENKETPKPVQRREELEKIVDRDENFEQRVRHLAEQPLSYLQREARQIYDAQRQTGVETREQKDRLYELSRGLYEKRKDIEEGKYKPGAPQQHLLTSTEQLIDAMSPYKDNREQKQYRRTGE